MILGIMFILAGVLIAVYPPLLSLIVAALLIMLGLSFIGISYHAKKISRNFRNPYMNFFMRF